MKKYKVIAIMGKAGSGKDTIMRSVLAELPTHLHKIINCTTRPMREGELDGVNYFFLSDNDFATKVLQNEMIEYSQHRWWYGTMLSSLNPMAINIGVFNPTAVKELLAHPQIDVTVFSLEVNDKIRLLRQLQREENPDVAEIVRRFGTDEEDFVVIETIPHIRVCNNSATDLVDAITTITQTVVGQIQTTDIK